MEEPIVEKPKDTTPPDVKPEDTTPPDVKSEDTTPRDAAAQVVTPQNVAPEEANPLSVQLMVELPSIPIPAIPILEETKEKVEEPKPTEPESTEEAQVKKSGFFGFGRKKKPAPPKKNQYAIKYAIPLGPVTVRVRWSPYNILSIRSSGLYTRRFVVLSTKTRTTVMWSCTSGFSWYRS